MKGRTSGNRRGLATLLAFCLAAGAAHQTWAASQGLKVDLVIETSDGSPPAAGQTVSITLSYRDLVTGRGPKGLTPAAWVRRLQPDRLPCHDAAQNFRITRSVSRDDVPLFGAWIGLVHLDGNFGLIDPKIDFQGTNLVAMKPIGGLPNALTATRGFPSLFVSSPQRDAVLRLTLPDLALATRLSGIDEPGDMVEGDRGAIFVAENSTGNVLFADEEGRVQKRLPVGKPPLRLSEVPASLRFPAGVFARSSDGAALWFERANGETIHSYPPPAFDGSGDTASWPGGIAASRAGEAALHILYRDAPARQVAVSLAHPPDGFISEPGGRYLLAWSNEARLAELVETAYGKVVQSFALDFPISEAVFSGETLFVGYDGSARVSIVDLKSRRGGGEALVRGVVLSAEQTAEGTTGKSPKVLLDAIGDDGMATALIEDGDLIHVLHGGALHASPIVGTIPVKGAGVRDLAILDRSLVETADSTFTTKVRLPDRGPLELVATTGVGGLTSCLPIALADDGQSAEPPEPHLIRLDREAVRAGQETQIRLQLANVDAADLERIPLVAMALSGSWQAEITGVRQADGSYLARASFPAPGEYPLILPARVAGKELAPLLVEVGR